MTLAARVIAHLERHGVPAAVIGGVALGAHGIARATLDTDVLVTDTAVLSSVFWRGMRGAARAEIRRGDADDPLGGVVRFRSRRNSVDVLVGRGRWMQRMLDHRTWLRVGRGRLPIVDRADLVLLKLYAAGPQDLLDVRLLIEMDAVTLRQTVEERVAEAPRSVSLRWRRMMS